MVASRAAPLGSTLGDSKREISEKSIEMTLIAGFRSFDTPVLIGDFLITDGDAKSGLQKKVLLVADNFALAWTGHLLAADSVVKSLQSSLDLAAVTLKSVRAILTDPATSDLGQLHVSLVC